MINEFRQIFQLFVTHYPWIAMFFSFFLGWLLMPMVLKISIRKQLVVKPNKRSSHKGRIPNVGGMNIFVTFIITLLFFATSPLCIDAFSQHEVHSKGQLMLAGLLCIFAVGFTDDLIDISAKKKFLGEFIAAFIIVVMADIRLTNFHGFLFISEITPDLVWLSYLVSIFLFVLLVNSINLIDGVDGLATGLGMAISLFYAIYFQLVTETNLAVIAYTLIGSLAIFFIYNVFGNKRKIFMGDSGSLLLGALLYIFVISFCQYNTRPGMLESGSPYFFYTSAATAACTLAVPLFDTLRVMITRIKNGKSPFKADKRHAHHLLLELGLKHWQVTLTLVLVNTSFMLLGIIGRNWHNWLLGGIAIIIAIIYTLFLWKLVNRKRRSTHITE